MKGTSKIREQGYKDPLLVKVMKAHGYDELPLYKHRPRNSTRNGGVGPTLRSSATDQSTRCRQASKTSVAALPRSNNMRVRSGPTMLGLPASRQS